MNQNEENEEYEERPRFNTFQVYIIKVLCVIAFVAIVAVCFLHRNEIRNNLQYYTFERQISNQQSPLELATEEEKTAMSDSLIKSVYIHRSENVNLQEEKKEKWYLTFQDIKEYTEEIVRTIKERKKER